LTLPKFLLSGLSTLVILVIGWPIIMTYPAIKSEKATGIAVFIGGFTEALFTLWFWLSAILLLLFFWYTSQLGSRILRLLLFWIPTVLATVLGSAVFTLYGYLLRHRPK